jgi:hypothetical protein
LKLRKILFSVAPAGPLLSPPYVDVTDFAILDQCTELILGDAKSACGFLAVQEIAGHQAASARTNGGT